MRTYTTVSGSSFSRHAAFMVVGLALLLGASMASPALADSTSSNGVTDWLYQSAQEHRREGRNNEAIHDLHKVLAIDPYHAGAQQALQELEGRQYARREQTMEATLTQVSRSSGALAAAPLGAAVRIPDPRVTGVKWFYVFGRDGNPFYGAQQAPQVFFVEVPRADGGTVSIRVLDADIRGNYDERDGGWDTSTLFSVFGGMELLESQLVGPDAPDGTTVDFGPFPLEQGEVQGNQAVFRVEAEGGSGNDNNLFALEVKPSHAQAFALTPAIRLASTTGKRMRFYPAVPAGTTAIRASNYDLDPTGGDAFLGPTETRLQRINDSQSAAWAQTDITVPGDSVGARWMYEIRKGTQAHANMALRLENQEGRPLRIYFSPGGQAPVAVPEAPRVVAPPVMAPVGTCNTFVFDASASSDPDNQRLVYHWDFGDGTTGEGVRTRHTYAKAGDYQVLLRVNDGSPTNCCEAQTVQSLHVNTPPKAVVEAPAWSCAGGSVHFSAAGSTDSPGERLAYRWDFGDGTTGEGAAATHAYARGGTYHVTVTVDDQQGTSCSTDLATTVVRVNTPPVAQANDQITLCATQPKEPLTVQFNGTGSSDPDRDPLTYAWSFGDGSTGTGAKVSHTYERGGRYTATLRVDDGTGTTCSSATTTVPVQLNHAPLAVAGPDVLGCPDVAMTFDATASSDPDGQPLAYRWDFGDGSTGTGATATHTYASQGNYRVRLTVDDGQNMACSTAGTQFTATVNAPPVAQMTIEGERGVARSTTVNTE